MKLQEMREKTVDELNNAVVDFKKQLFDLRIQKSLHKLENTAQIGQIKTLIAQVKTVIREKQVTK